MKHEAVDVAGADVRERPAGAVAEGGAVDAAGLGPVEGCAVLPRMMEGEMEVHCLHCGQPETIRAKPHESLLGKIIDWMMFVDGRCGKCGRGEPRLARTEEESHGC